MFVNITRNKLLINKNSAHRKSVKSKKSQPRCRHCGGLVRVDEEFTACMMCSRVADHICATCSFAPPAEIAKNKKSA